MDGKDDREPPKLPFQAWGSRRKQILQESSVLEGQLVGLLEESSSGSSPGHAGPSTLASDTACSSVASESEVGEALHFMHQFLQDDHQGSSDRARFLDCLDIFISAIIEKKERFKEEIYNPSLIRDSLQVLLPSASSPRAHDREVTLARMARLIRCIPSQALGQGMEDLKLGQLAGCFALCSGDPCEAVRLWAANGLHHLYTLIVHHKRRNLSVDSQAYHDLLNEWKEEKIFWLIWFSDIEDTTTVFKKWLPAEDQTEFVLMAIRGMSSNSIYDTKCAILVLRAMLSSPMPELVGASKSVELTYKHLEHITDNVGRREVFRYLCHLGRAYPEEVVRALLGCSLECDNTATAMWRALTRSSDLAFKMLATLQSLLSKQPLHPGHLANKAALHPLAAISALNGILKDPSETCKAVLNNIYPTLSIALLCQISNMLHSTPKEIEIFWQQKTLPALDPLRFALRIFKALLRCASRRDEVLLMIQRRGSELLVDPATHQKGLHLFARAMVKKEDCASILPYLLQTLDNPEDCRHVTMMTFLVELLRHRPLENNAEDLIIRQLGRQLNGATEALRALAMEGLIQLADDPEKMAKLEPALPDIMARLWDPSRAVNIKALRVLRGILASPEVSPLRLEVASGVLPLLDDASHKVRLEAIRTFDSLFRVIRKEEKGAMRVLARQSLVPLIIHLFDRSPAVIQASREALCSVDLCLKSFFQRTIAKKDPWDYSLNLLKRYRKKGNTIFKEQALCYLESPHNSIRQVALKILQTITKSPATLHAIAAVLNLMNTKNDQDIQDQIHRITEDLAGETSERQEINCWGSLPKVFCR